MSGFQNPWTSCSGRMKTNWLNMHKNEQRRGSGFQNPCVNGMQGSLLPRKAPLSRGHIPQSWQAPWVYLKVPQSYQPQQDGCLQPQCSSLDMPVLLHIRRVSLSLGGGFTPCRHLRSSSGREHTGLRIYNLVSPVKMITWWMKLGGRLPWATLKVSQWVVV